MNEKKKRKEKRRMKTRCVEVKKKGLEDTVEFLRFHCNKIKAFTKSITWERWLESLFMDKMTVMFFWLPHLISE